MMINRKKKLSLMIALLSLACTGLEAQNVWKGTWATAVEYTGKGDMPKESLSNRSCRQVVHVSFGGNEMRLKLSNEFSKEPVDIKSVYIADTDASANWEIKAKTVKYLKFNGKKNVTIAPGKAIYSDDLKFTLKAGQRLTITIDYGEQTPEHATSHRGSRTTSYIVNSSVRTAKPMDKSFVEGEKVDHWYNLSAIDVKTDVKTPVVAVLGNSITDGRGSTTNMQNRWTDFLSDALNAEKPYGVLNLGIGGNCVVEGGLSEPAMKRFDRDILGQTGVDKLVIFEGTNDIGCCGGNYEHVADTLIACYKVLIAKAKAKGIKVYGATITPTKGNGWYSYWHEAMRQQVNEWIRKGGFFDEIIDFDELVRDPQDPQRLKEDYSDDWLHLNPKGYEAMGKFAAEKLK
jgi:lysophospholipase L1-like esterase